MIAPTLLVLLALAAPGAEEPRPVLEARNGEAIAAGLGYGDADLPVGRHLLTGIALDAERVVFHLRPAGGGDPVELWGLHPAAPAPDGHLRADATATLALYAPEPLAPALVETARALAARLPPLAWSVPDRGPPLALPAPVRGLVARPATDAGAEWLVPEEVLAAALAGARSVPPLWGLGVLLALGAAVRRHLRERLLAGRAATLAGLVALALGLRLALATPWPISFVEVERVLPSPDGPFSFFPDMLRPLFADSPDGLARQAGVNLGLGVLAVALTALLGEAWLGGRAGWLAGAFLAVLPLQIVFGRTSTVEVAVTAFVVAAAFLTEALFARPSALAGLAAALAWGLVVQLRPEGPGYVLAPGLWALADPRGRAWLRRARASLPALGLLLASVGVALGRYWAGTGVSPVAAIPGEVFGSLPAVLAGNAWDLLADPRWHAPALGALALAGLAWGRGLWRLAALLLGAALPVVLLAAKGRAVGQAFDVTDLRYVLAAQPFQALSAAAAVAGVARSLSGAGRALVLAPAALATAVLASPLARQDDLRRPTALQAEHEALARALPQVQPDASVLAFAPGGGRYSIGRQLAYRLTTLAREHGAAVSGVRVLEREVVAPDAAGPLYYWRGWYELRAESEGWAGQKSTFRASLDRGFEQEPVFEDRRTVATAAGPVPMELGLYRLRARPEAVSPRP